MFNNLLKAVVGTVVELPVAIIKDTVTLGGSITNEESAIAKSCEKISKNIGDATKPDKERNNV